MHTRNNLLKKVFILFMLVLIPTTAAGFYALHKSNVRQQKETLSSIASNTSTYISHMDESLKQIYLANINIVNGSLIQNLSVMYPYLSEYERANQINLLRNQLHNSYVSSPFLESAHAYLFPYALALNSTTYSRGSFETLNDTQCNAYQKLAAYHGHMQYYMDPLYKQQTLSVFMMADTRNTNYAVNLILSQPALKSYLDANMSYHGEYYVYGLENGYLLSNLSKELEPETTWLLSHFRNEEANGSKEIRLGGEDFFAFPYQTSYAKGTYIRLIPAHTILSSVQYSYWFMFLFFLVIVLACMLFFIGIYRMVHKPLVKLTDAFEELENGHFSVQIAPCESADFAYLFQAFNDMSIRLGRLIERDYQQKLLLQKAELKQLQAQINPHFLYNSFFMLQRLIMLDQEQAQEVAGALASCFRYITKNSMDKVTLQEEYDYACNYTYIQGLRFAGRITIEMDPLPEVFCHIPVPKLILQPILENAFNYGLHNKAADGLLRVTFLPGDGFLTIRIEDNGDELSEETLVRLREKLSDVDSTASQMEMSGILNIQRRLHIFSNHENTLCVSHSALGGLCVEMTLQTKSK